MIRTTFGKFLIENHLPRGQCYADLQMWGQSGMEIATKQSKKIEQFRPYKDPFKPRFSKFIFNLLAITIKFVKVKLKLITGLNKLDSIMTHIDLFSHRIIHIV
jgi:hypothetical protein